MGSFLRINVALLMAAAALLCTRIEGQDATCRLEITSGSAAAGKVATVELRVSNGDPLTGVQVNLRADPKLSLTSESINELVTAEFVQVEVGQECVAYALVLDVENEESLPAGDDQPIAELSLLVLPGAVPGNELPVAFADVCGDPPKANLLVMVLAGPPPSVYKCYPQAADLTAGAVLVESDGVGVYAADCNGDVKIDIADAVYLLQYLFAHKSPPGCAKAADANDDDKLDIADAIKILGYLFVRQTLTLPDGTEVLSAAHPGCAAYAPAHVPETISNLSGCEKECVE